MGMPSISKLLIGLALFSGVILGLGVFSGSLFTNYGIPDGQNLSYISRTQELSNFTTSVQSNIQSRGGVIENIFTSAALIWNVFIQMLTLPLTFTGLIGDVNTGINAATGSTQVGFIPQWFIGMIDVIVLIIIILGVASIISNRQVEM